jgi:hypothetical protein
MSAKLKINREILLRGDVYQVYISHRFYTFPSLRKAEDFLRGVDNYLNTQFEMVNANLISVYATYRRLSWYIHSYDRSAIRLQINDVEKSIELSISRADWSSWRDTVFAKLDYSIELLDNVLHRMQEISKEKKYTVLGGEIRANIRSIEMMKVEVERFNFENRKYLASDLQVVHKKAINL